MTILVLIILTLLSYIVGDTIGLLIFLFVLAYILEFSSKKYGIQNLWRVATWGVPYASQVTHKLPSTREADKKTMLLDIDDLEIGHNRDTNEVFALLEVKKVVYAGSTCYAMVVIPSGIRPDTTEIIRFQNANLWTLLESESKENAKTETGTNGGKIWCRSEDIVEYTKLGTDTVRKQAKELAEFYDLKNYKLRIGNEVYFSPEIVEKMNQRNAKYPPLSALKGHNV